MTKPYTIHTTALLALVAFGCLTGKGQDVKPVANEVPPGREDRAPYDYEARLRTDPLMMPYYTGTIVPAPRKVSYQDRFLPMSNVAIVVGKDVADPGPLVEVLQDRISRYGGTSAIVDNAPAGVTAVISIGDTSYAKDQKNIPPVPDQAEGYILVATQAGETPLVVLKGRDRLGTLWSIASLTQLIHWRDNQPMARTATVVDYPAMQHRGFLMSRAQGYLFAKNTGRKRGTYERWPDEKIKEIFMLHRQFLLLAKCNEPFYQDLTRADCYDYFWKEPESMPSDAHIENDIAWMGRMLSPLGIKWWGALRPHAAGNETFPGELSLKLSADEKSLNGLLYFGRLMEKAGGHFAISLDDIRFPITPYDQAHLGSAREVDTWLITRVMATLKEEFPAARLLVCPPFYWGPEGTRGAASYGEDRDAYLLKIGEAWPPEVEVFWTGEKVNGRTMATRDFAAWEVERIKRKPYFWQNALGFGWHYGRRYFPTDGINFPEYYWAGWEEQIAWYGFNSTFPNLYLGNLVSLDFQWNVQGYVSGGDVEVARGVRESIEKMLGQGALPLTKNFTAALAYFDAYHQPLNRNKTETANRRLRAAQNYDELERKRDEVVAALDVLKQRYPVAIPTWTEFDWFAQAANLVDSVKKDPALELYRHAVAQRARATQAGEFRPGKDVFLSASHFEGGTLTAVAEDSLDPGKKVAAVTLSAPQNEAHCAIAIPADEKGHLRYALLMNARKGPSASKLVMTLNDEEFFSGQTPFGNDGTKTVTFAFPKGVLVKPGAANLLKISLTGSTAVQADTANPLAKAPPLAIYYAVLQRD